MNTEKLLYGSVYIVYMLSIVLFEFLNSKVIIIDVAIHKLQTKCYIQIYMM